MKMSCTIIELLLNEKELSLNSMGTLNLKNLTNLHNMN